MLKFPKYLTDLVPESLISLGTYSLYLVIYKVNLQKRVVGLGITGVSVVKNHEIIALFKTNHLNI